MCVCGGGVVVWVGGSGGCGCGCGRAGGREGRREEGARKSLVSCARVVLGQDRLARSAEGGSKAINHGGDQGATHDAAGHKSWKGRSESRAKAKATTRDPRGGLPPRVIRRRRWTEARSCPSKEASKSWSRKSPLKPRW